jgi:alanyl aminopeptidase
MPNADAAGYFRFRMAASDLERSSGAWEQLTPRERLAFADSMSAGFDAGDVSLPTMLVLARRMVRDADRRIALAPTDLLGFVDEYLVDDGQRAALQRLAQALYRDRFRRLGWGRGAEVDGETQLLRAELIAFLALTAGDQEVRRAATVRAQAFLRPAAPEVDQSAVPPDLLPTVLAVAVQDGGADVFDRVEASLHATSDTRLRAALLTALAQARDPALAARARALVLDPRLRVNEALDPLAVQLAARETRPDAWTFVKEHWSGIVGRVSESGAGMLPWFAARFCDPAGHAEVQAFFTPKVEELRGGPRNLAGALERIQTCIARTRLHKAAVPEVLDAAGRTNRN